MKTGGVGPTSTVCAGVKVGVSSSRKFFQPRSTPAEQDPGRDHERGAAAPRSACRPGASPVRSRVVRSCHHVLGPYGTDSSLRATGTGLLGCTSGRHGAGLTRGSHGALGRPVATGGHGPSSAGSSAAAAARLGPYQVSSRPLTSTDGTPGNASGPSSAAKR